MTAEKARELGCTPLMELVDYAVAGFDALLMEYTILLHKKAAEKAKYAD